MAAPSFAPPTEIKNPDSIIVDVRTAAEHQEKHLEQAHDHIPLDRLDPREFMLKHGLDKDFPVYILCRSGGRAKTAAEKFMAAGYPNAKVIEGGIIACENRNIPISRPSATSIPAGYIKIPSIECQVRITAGFLVMLGVFLGALLSPIFYFLAFAVGAGLFYSGMTDTCTMAMFLMKAPWNKASAISSPACPIGFGSDKIKEPGGGCA